MQQFWLGDMKFFALDQQVLLDQLEMSKDQITLVSLTIENQKSGQRGETMSHHALCSGGTFCCPAKAVVARAIDLVQMKATNDTLICAFQELVALPWQHVRSSHIVCAVKDVVTALRLPKKKGFLLSKIGLHSLRAGRAMELYLNKKMALEIQCAGHWTSNTFLEYIHSQLDVSSLGLAKAMANDIPFMNMAQK